MTTQPQGIKTCGTCGGARTVVVDTSSGGVTRRNVQTCGTCGGAGLVHA